MNIDQLFLRAVFKFLEDNHQKTIQWEDAVKSCFEMFPETFGFEKYKQWPDSGKIHFCIRRCVNDRHWLVGDIKIGFSLTEIGRTIGSVNIENKKYKDVQERKIGSGTDPRLLNYIKESNLFKTYLKNPANFYPAESEIRSILKATMETDYKTLIRNLEYLKKVIKDYGKDDLIAFSEKLELKLKEIIENE